MLNKLPYLFLLFSLVALAACEGEKSASVDSLTKPLPSAPTPTPNPNATDLQRVAQGTLAPDFTLDDQKGRMHKLKQYRGKYVVLVFYRGYF